MKESGTVYWAAPNTMATNSSGFTAIPGGGRGGINGKFDLINKYAMFWTSSGDVYNPNVKALAYYLLYNGDQLTQASSDMNSGMSVRCIKDEKD